MKKRGFDMDLSSPRSSPSGAFRLLRALLGLAPGGDLSQGRVRGAECPLESESVRGSLTVATVYSQQPEKERSLAIGRLRNAAINKILLRDSSSNQEKKKAEKNLYEV